MTETRELETHGELITHIRHVLNMAAFALEQDPEAYQDCVVALANLKTIEGDLADAIERHEKYTHTH